MADTTENAVTGGQDDDRLARIRVKVRALRRHIIVYAAVNAVLFLIDIFGDDGLWFMWPLMAWGIGLAIHWTSVMRPEILNNLGRDWEDRTVDRLAERDDR